MGFMLAQSHILYTVSTRHNHRSCLRVFLQQWPNSSESFDFMSCLHAKRYSMAELLEVLSTIDNRKEFWLIVGVSGVLKAHKLVPLLCCQKEKHT